MSRSVPKRQHAVKITRTSAGAALSRLVVQVFRLDGALTAAGDALARPTGQTTARWRVLAAVEQQPLTVAQIARAWSLARQSVQRIADALEQDGLVAYAETQPIGRPSSSSSHPPVSRPSSGSRQRRRRGPTTSENGSA